MSEKCLSFIFIHHNGEITNTLEGAAFCSQNPVGVNISSFVTLLKLHNTILRKLGQLNWKQITQVVYRLPTAVECMRVCDVQLSLQMHQHPK